MDLVGVWVVGVHGNLLHKQQEILVLEYSNHSNFIADAYIEQITRPAKPPCYTCQLWLLVIYFVNVLNL